MRIVILGNPYAMQIELLATTKRGFGTRDWATIAILSSLGATLSVTANYAGDILKAIPFLPFGSKQLIAGIHVLWITLAISLTGKTGTGTVTGILKGLVEMTLFSSHGVTVIIISTLQGMIVDVVYRLLKDNKYSIYIAGGLSSMSNVAVLQFLLLFSFPSSVFAVMYVSAFISGVFFSGLIGVRVKDIVSRMNL
jgi:ABC-type thiamin/hydroxymethylpyrimidine transport system permease subunit